MLEPRPHRVAVQVDDSTRARIAAVASRNNRSISQTAALLLLLGLEGRGRRTLSDVLEQRRHPLRPPRMPRTRDQRGAVGVARA